MYTEPIVSKNAVTVSTSLVYLFSLFGVCRTVISDHGSEFFAEVTRLVYNLIQVPQQFTLSYIYHCLGACARTHRTLAESSHPVLKVGISFAHDCVLYEKCCSLENTVLTI